MFTSMPSIRTFRLLHAEVCQALTTDRAQHGIVTLAALWSFTQAAKRADNCYCARLDCGSLKCFAVSLTEPPLR